MSDAKIPQECNATAPTARQDWTEEELNRFILEEGPLTPGELDALPEAVRLNYFSTLARRLARVGAEAFRRQVGRRRDAAPIEAHGSTIRTVATRALNLLLDHQAKLL